MLRCLFPDCDFTAEIALTADGWLPDDEIPHVEHQKRVVIDHINQAHDEAHALIPCVHDMQELERFVAVAIDPSGVKHDQPQIRLQCVRCGQFEVRADEPTEDNADG